ncbi:MAG: hypothetical protein KDD53_12555, partial [Bdellovibrionales bacterium]|nr:hypothetical protein [Bdellovibrionales bacterium]
KPNSEFFGSDTIELAKISGDRVATEKFREVEEFFSALSNRPRDALARWSSLSAEHVRSFVFNRFTRVILNDHLDIFPDDNVESLELRARIATEIAIRRFDPQNPRAISKLIQEIRLGLWIETGREPLLRNSDPYFIPSEALFDSYAKSDASNALNVLSLLRHQQIKMSRRDHGESDSTVSLRQVFSRRFLRGESPERTAVRYGQKIATVGLQTLRIVKLLNGKGTKALYAKSANHGEEATKERRPRTRAYVPDRQGLPVIRLVSYVRALLNGSQDVESIKRLEPQALAKTFHTTPGVVKVGLHRKLSDEERSEVKRLREIGRRERPEKRERAWRIREMVRTVKGRLKTFDSN